MASEIRVNRLSNRSGLSTITFANGGVQFSGITTFANGEFYVGTGATIINPSSNEFNFHTGGSNRFTINNSGANLGTGNITAVDATFTGNVSIGKTLTYEDVKNVDSVGVVTARTGVKVTGGDLTVGTAITASSVTGNVTQDVGITTFSGSAVWFKGATANKDMYWSKSSGATVYKDNAQILMGDSSDLQISHDGTNSTILNTTGELIVRDDSRVRIRTDQLVINSGDNTESIIYAAKDGAVELYHNNSKKLETTSSGVTVTGDMNISDGTGQSHYQITQTNGNTVKFGIVSGSDIELSGSSNNSMYFKTNNIQRLRITGPGLISIGDESNLDSQLTVTQAQGDCIRLRSNATNNTFKYGIIKQEPYNNNALGVQIIGGKSDSGYSEVAIGGGIDGGYAATHIDFYTGATTTTTTGTRRLRINSNGRLTLSDSEGIKLSAKTSTLYSADGALSYYATDNGVYLNGAGADGWLRLQASGSANDRTSINISGHSRTNGDEIYFKTNSTERLRINSSGYVGVKRSTPLANLHVSNNELAIGANPTSAAAPNATYDGLVVDGEAASFINLRSRGNGSDSYCRLAFSDDTRSRGYVEYRHKDGGGDDTMRFATLGTERMRIDSSGNVYLKSSSNNQQPKLRIESYGEYGEIKADGNGSIIIDADPDFNSANSYIGFSVDGSVKSTIDSNGTLNIGATTPTFSSPTPSLNIEKASTGSGPVISLYNSQSANAASTCDILVRQNYRDSNKIIFGRENANNWQASAASVASFTAFHTNNGSGIAEKMRITSTGDVGINITSPIRKFHVNGTARVSGTFEAYPSSTSAISAGIFYNNSTGASADCRVQIKTYANQGADPYLHFDAGGSNFICGMKYEGTTQNKFMIGPGDSPSGGMTGGIYVHGNGRVSLNSSGIPSRRFNISDTGAVQIWTYGNCAAHFSAQYQSSTNSGTQYYNVFTRLDGSWDGYLVSSTDGQITLSNNSDYRLKENVVSMTNGIDIVKKLNPITYKWKASTGRDTSVTMQGFFAHEVDEAGVLGAVDGGKDAVWDTPENPEEAAEGSPRYQGLSLERLVPTLTAALKESIARIETLEAEVAVLKSS